MHDRFNKSTKMFTNTVSILKHMKCQLANSTAVLVSGRVGEGRVGEGRGRTSQTGSNHDQSIICGYRSVILHQNDTCTRVLTKEACILTVIQCHSIAHNIVTAYPQNDTCTRASKLHTS